VNAGNTTAYGAELELRHFVNEYLEWFVNYTYTKTKVRNDLDPDQDGANISFVPDYMANVGAMIKLPKKLTISPYLHMVGSYYDSTSKSGRLKFGPYQVVNANIQKLLVKTQGYRANLNIDLNNITNKRYEMPWQFRDPGFSAFGSIEIIF
jgi:outer membrane receptor protein involved in Fe transport